MTKRLQSSVLFLIFAVSAFAVAPNEVPKPGWNLFSKQQDIQLGREAAAQVERQYQIVNDPVLNEFVNKIGRRLAATPEAGNFPYTFKVVNDQSINAFALPGGPTFVNVGLLRAADNEAQVAGVLAHELSHVALRHGTHQASRANLIQLPAMLAGGILGGSGSMLGSLAQLGIGLGANSVLLKFSRDAESEADNLGARMMADAGYNPIELARFFEKLQASGGSRGPQFLSDHPNPGNRFQAIQEEIRYLPSRNYNYSTGLFPQVKAELNNGRFQSSEGTRARSTSSDYTNEQPSGRFRRYTSRSFDIDYPDNWQAYGDPQSGTVTLAPPDGVQQGQVAYGAIVSYYYPQGESVDLRNDTRNLIARLQQSNPSLQMGGQRTRTVNVDRENALVTVLYSDSPYRGETEHDTLVTVARPDGLWYAIFIAPASLGHQFSGTFDRMMRSINFH